MKKAVAIFVVVIVSLALCACSSSETIQMTTNNDIAEAKDVLDRDCEEFIDKISETQLVYSEKKYGYDFYKYTIYVGDEYSTEYEMMHDILMGIQNGVDVGEKFGIVESSVVCNGEEYKINKDTYYLIKSSDISWEWSPTGQTTKDKYSSLTNFEKKQICEYIQDRYDYYDSISGGYAGDKYSDTIMQEAANKYGITEEQASIIWMNCYSY